MQNNTFTIYKLKNYFIFKNKEGSFFTNKEMTDKVESYTGSIDKVVKRLEKDKGYNLRIDPSKPCFLYGDLDHVPSEDIFNNFIKLLCNVFDVSNDKISYTLSIKPNEFSYHWAIPSIQASPKILKNILTKSKFDEFKQYIDLSIYTSHWFRLPNQTNEAKKIAHHIIHEKMADFIVDYCDNCDEIIEDKIVVEPSSKPKVVNVDANITDTINNFFVVYQV